MVQPRPFGRRVNPQHRVSRPVQSAEARGRPKDEAGVADIAVRPVSPVLQDTNASTFDDDVEEPWQSRKHGFEIPWRPLALMASLCFGIASFVLPDTVNDAVQWLLYGLMAASLYAGFSKRRTGAKG